MRFKCWSSFPLKFHRMVTFCLQIVSINAVKLLGFASLEKCINWKNADKRKGNWTMLQRNISSPSKQTSLVLNECLLLSKTFHVQNNGVIVMNLVSLVSADRWSGAILLTIITMTDDWVSGRCISQNVFEMSISRNVIPWFIYENGVSNDRQLDCLYKNVQANATQGVFVSWHHHAYGYPIFDEAEWRIYASVR